MGTYVYRVVPFEGKIWGRRLSVDPSRDEVDVEVWGYDAAIGLCGAPRLRGLDETSIDGIAAVNSCSFST